MKTQLQIVSIENPIVLVRRGLIAMMLVLFATMALAQTTVVDIIVDSPDHTTLEAAVIAAELADDLSGEGPFTVFAPTDAAFAALPEGTVSSLLQDPTGELAEILKYHVIGSQITSSQLADGQVVKTLNGDSVTISFQDGSFFVDNAKITGPDIHTDNGVVHVIDAVIVPTSTVVDVIVGSADHTILEAAVIAAELADDLSGEGPFTVFAPTDAAFAALPEGTVSSLLEDPTGALAQILLYHVVNAKALSTDLSDGQMITTLEGSDVTVSISEGNVFINEAQVTSADIMTDNGVVHVIDAVLTSNTAIRDVMIDVESVRVFPNPASEYVNVNFSVLESSELKIEMYDMLGQQVRVLDQGYVFEGTYTVEFPLYDLDSGMYLLIIKTGNGQIANKVKVMN